MSGGPADRDGSSSGDSLRARLGRLRGSAWWPWFKRTLAVVFFGLVGWLLIHQARGIDWGRVADSMLARPLSVLALAALLAALSHLVYSSFDLFGRKVTGHTLPTSRVMATTFVSYVFNLNLGSLIGGMGFRYRLYSRQGLAAQTITTVVATSMLTNWIGYLLLGGIVLIVRPLELPSDWAVASSQLRMIGIAMVGIAVAWQLACGLSRRREWHFSSHSITLPSARLAALQFVASTTNWALMGAIIYVLLEGRVDYPLVLGTMMVAAVAGVIAHVPAGLGVLEAVFVGLLGASVEPSELIGALLLYRAFYYLAPLLVALLMQWRLESTARGRRSDNADQPRAPQPPNAAVELSS